MIWRVSLEVLLILKYEGDVVPQVSRVDIGSPAEEVSQEINKILPLINDFPAVVAENSSSPSWSDKSTLSSPNWDLWRRRGACRIWKAVLISMAIDPETNLRTNLKKDNSHLYDEYFRRKEDVIAHYGLIPEFKAIKHAKAGSRPGEKYILLNSLLKFAKNQHWENLDAFEQGMQIHTHEAGTGYISNFSFEALTEETRNGLVRTGALLRLLEDVLIKRDTTNAAKFLHGEKLNISTVAERVEKIIGVAAGQEKVKNFAREANRRYLAKAQNSLRSNG